MISVLVADDSFFMRKLISDILRADPEIRVVGAVSDGQQVLEAVRTLKPDVITMDVDMPKMDGLTATKKLMQQPDAKPIVIMLSAFSKDRANLMLECLRAGAFDCILKPSGELSLDIERVEAQLRSQVKAAAKARKSALRRIPEPVEKKTVPVMNGSGFPLIIIGASTGGPPVLEEIFETLPGVPDAAVIVVQHMPEKFTASMAERLDKVSPLKVKEAEEGETIKPGVALVAPGNRHLFLRKSDSSAEDLVRLTKDAPVNGMRPSIDVTMESAARVFQGPLVGILLTGMGEDGVRGMRAIHDRGGKTAVQDPSTCVVDSMVRGALKGVDGTKAMTPARISHSLATLSF